MSLFRDSMRPPPLASDAALRRYIDLVRAELEPDPLFRRRLRGLVTNRFVAVREGGAVAMTGISPARAMGRLGRACLYASVALAASVGVTMAASQSALPGDPLYGVKLRIEELRVTALPAEFRDELAVYVLTERVGELSQLTAAGRTEQAEALVEVIEDQVAVVAALDLPAETESGLIAAQLDVLDTLVESLPPEAQQAIQRAMSGGPGLVKAGRDPATGHGHDATAGGGQDRVPAAGDVAATDGTDGADANGTGAEPPGQVSKPSMTPQRTTTPEPEATPEPAETPMPTPKAHGPGQGADAQGDEGSD
ncbi:MAG TPA: DUF5667 domain-containing protein [Candidatus Limnocylindria bacterium]|nr:DUF5667 domain-containing protein [Candidatus Limnocylindria bacterium]